MCVIILTNPNNQITADELKEAWTVNPDGAGFAYAAADGVHFQRGFMNCDYFIKRVMELQQKHELLLHLRISTAAGVTPQGTHPYKAGNVLKMQGTTNAPVIAMNGVISGQKLKTKRGAKLNDTASYIAEHADAFKVINRDILDIIAHDTAAKWAAVTKDGIIHSDDFQYHDGRLYSNLNHIWSYNLLNAYYNDVYDYDYHSSNCCGNLNYIEELIEDKALAAIKKDKRLYLELREYEYQHCKYYDCKYCEGCIADIKSKHDAQRFLDNNIYIWDAINDDTGAY